MLSSNAAFHYTGRLGQLSLIQKTLVIFHIDTMTVFFVQMIILQNHSDYESTEWNLCCRDHRIMFLLTLFLLLLINIS